MALVALAWLYFTQGNILIAGAAYWFYKKQKAATAAQGGAAPAAKPIK